MRYALKPFTYAVRETLTWRGILSIGAITLAPFGLIHGLIWLLT